MNLNTNGIFGIILMKFHYLSGFKKKRKKPLIYKTWRPIYYENHFKSTINDMFLNLNKIDKAFFYY